jgi:hypothetical protein
MIGQTLYHVTPTRNVPRILREGLRRFQPSRWRRAGNGERYGDGEIYAFTHPDDALRWAFKMDWALHTASNTGKISIIEFAAGERPWQVDLNDPLSQAGRRGDWLKSEHPVEPAQIIAVTVALIAKELTFGVETLAVPTEHPGDTVDIDLFIVCATQAITDPLSNWPAGPGWYWCPHEEEQDSVGPFETRDAALDDLYALLRVARPEVGARTSGHPL